MSPPAPIPLCVDLDGTLLQTDTLSESILLLFKKNPFSVFQLPLWWLRGRPHLKQEIAARVDLDVDTLPLSLEFLEFLRGEQQAGRRLLLVTGTDIRIARAVGGHIGMFEEILASDGKTNLSGEGKARVLAERFGKRGFDYAGNAGMDLAVWAEARRAIVVNGSRELAEKAAACCEVEKVFAPPAAGFATWRAALRVHQWAKNTLIFLPLLGAHQWRNPGKLGAAGVAFLAFSICASSVYILNDLLDLEADRHHAAKRHRPFASGRLSPLTGAFIAALLLVESFAVALWLPSAFIAVLAVYYLLTLSYSLQLKQVAVLDVLTLAALYSIRVVAGGYAVRVSVSDWLLGFSIFLFLSLAFVKRFTELQQVQRDKNESIRGRGYQVGDLGLISIMGVASGYLAVLVLALYITNPQVTQLYRNPTALWFACPVFLYWINRVWLLAHRGLLHEDPIVFALKDKPSWLVFLILLILGAVALPI